jgi:hypothetical protein
LGSAGEKVAPRRKKRKIPSSENVSCNMSSRQSVTWALRRDHAAGVGAQHGKLFILTLPYAKNVQCLTVGNFTHSYTSCFANSQVVGYSNCLAASCRAAFQECARSEGLVTLAHHS